MAINEIPIDFSGGLNTSKHEAYIQNNEAQTYENAVSLDGTTRLDQRYVRKITSPYVAADANVRGSGYGKYGELPFTANSQKEQYVVAINGNIYLVDLTAATMAYTLVIGSSFAIDNKDWFFAQFSDHIYGVQSNKGFYRKLIGVGSDGTGDWTALSNPAAPTVKPVAVPALPTQPTYASSTAAATPATAATTTQDTAAGSWGLSYSVAQNGTMQLDITFAASQDWTYVDTIRFVVNIADSWSFTDLRLKSPLETTGYTATAQDWKARNFIANGAKFTEYTLRLSNIARATKAQTTGLSFRAFAFNGSAGMIVYTPSVYGVWLTIDSSSNPGGGDPTLQPLVYEYTYYNSTTGLESPPGPATTYPANAQNALGEWRTVTATTTGASGVDKIRFYRTVTSADGTVTRYRLTTVNNSGTPTYTDKLPLEDVLALPVFQPFTIPQTGYTAIGVWQDRLCVAVGPLLYISRQGDPTSFTPVGVDYDPTDPARARTFYPDDKRSENIIGLITGDALYIVTDKSVRALYGSSIDDWRLVKMPESEGSHGNRTHDAYRNGVLLLTDTGRLLYLSVDQEVPQEVNYKLRPRIGATGMTGSRIVAVRPNGEIEVRGESGRYFVLSVDGSWRSGVHTDASHSVIYTSGLAIRWVGFNGKLYEGGSDSYTTDDGTAVTWSVTGKQLVGERIRAKELYFGDTPQTVVAGSVTYPIVSVAGEGGSASFKPAVGEKTCKILIGSNETIGNGLEITIQGDLNTILQGASLRYDPGMSRAANK